MLRHERDIFIMDCHRPAETRTTVQRQRAAVFNPWTGPAPPESSGQPLHES
jgi:hypothetical protein